MLLRLTILIAVRSTWLEQLTDLLNLRSMLEVLLHIIPQH